MPSTLIIENDGPRIRRTNFWESEWSRRGGMLISPNAGAFRLLLPEAEAKAVAEMQGAVGCAVSRGPSPDLGLADAFEVLFDDGSDDPFALHLSPASFTTLPADADAGAVWTLTVWTPDGSDGTFRNRLAFPCLYRRSFFLPDLRPWRLP